jgi:hypothetical protein
MSSLQGTSSDLKQQAEQNKVDQDKQNLEDKKQADALKGFEDLLKQL